MSNVLNKPIPKGCLYGIVFPFLGVFILLFLGIINSVFLLEIPFRLICGWVFHVWETLPPFLVKWRVAVFPIGCLFLAGWLTHSFICRWAKAKRPDLKWRIKYTVSIYSLLFLSSAAAIAMSGIVHQFFWLSKEKVITQRSRGSDQGYAMMRTRELCQYMFFYFTENGRYPLTWDELENWNEGHFANGRYLFLGEVPEPFILLNSGSDRQLSSNDPLVLSPYIQSVNRYAIGLGDGTGILVNPEELKKILSEIQKPETDTPHE
jgi:hypothetical protein